MRTIGLVIMILLLAAAVFFSMANREIVGIGFWPLEVRQEMPMFVPILGAIVVGFVIGWIGCWKANGRVRRQLREALRRNRDDAVEIDRLKGELKKAQSTIPPERQIAA